MKHLIFSIFLLLPCLVSAQDLYLKMDGSLPRHRTSEWSIPDDEPNSTIYSKSYAYESYICYNELSFACEDRTTMSQMLPISALSTNPSLQNIKTIEQVEAMVAGMEYSQVFGWFRGFQNIYMVEILPNGTHIEVNKVVLTTRIK
jgi:hypothetical protein